MVDRSNNGKKLGTREFPAKFNHINPEEYLTVLPDILDFLLLAHREKDIILYFQTITKINEIIAKLNDKYEQMIEDQILDDRERNEESIIKNLQTVVTEILEFKHIVKTRLSLKIEKGIAVQYPIPPNLHLINFFITKQQEVQKLIKIFNDQRMARFHDHLNYINQRIQEVYTSNQDRLFEKIKVYLSPEYLEKKLKERRQNQ